MVHTDLPLPKGRSGLHVTRNRVHFRVEYWGRENDVLWNINSFQLYE